MLRKWMSFAALLGLLTLLAAPWVLAQQDGGESPSGEEPQPLPDPAFTVPASGGPSDAKAGLLQYGGSGVSYTSPLMSIPKPVPFGMDPNDAGYYRPDEPYDSCGDTMLNNHAPGEFLVGYYSEEAMLAAPQENVVETFPRYAPDSPYLQLLRFEDIANIEDPYERLVAEDAKMKEIAAWPGVKAISLNSYGCVE